MLKVIKILQNRIEVLNKQIIRVEKIADEPEMMCDYEFARSDLANFELEKLNLQSAIQTLSESQTT